MSEPERSRRALVEGFAPGIFLHQAKGVIKRSNEDISQAVTVVLFEVECECCFL